MFAQFLNLLQYVPQWVPCVARFFAQNVNQPSIIQSTGTDGAYQVL